jgi:hypothetical protein
MIPAYLGHRNIMHTVRCTQRCRRIDSIRFGGISYVTMWRTVDSERQDRRSQNSHKWSLEFRVGLVCACPHLSDPIATPPSRAARRSARDGTSTKRCVPWRDTSRRRRWLREPVTIRKMHRTSPPSEWLQRFTRIQRCRVAPSPSCSKTPKAVRSTGQAKCAKFREDVA